VFVALRLEELTNVFTFEVTQLFVQWHIEIWISQIAIVLGDFVFQNNVVPKRVPREIWQQTMILMTIFPVMRENQIGLNPPLQMFKVFLNCFSLERKETVAEILDDNFRLACTLKKRARAGFGLTRPATFGTEDDPTHLQTRSLRGQL
jgi:hypothetical protein